MREKLALGLRQAQALGGGAPGDAEASAKAKRGKKAKKKTKAAKSKDQVEELAETKNHDDGKDQPKTGGQAELEAHGGSQASLERSEDQDSPERSSERPQRSNIIREPKVTMEIGRASCRERV